MFCSFCGKEIPDNSSTCQFCGAALPQAQQQTPYQAPQQAPQQTPQQMPYQAPYGAPQQAPYGAPQQAPYQAPYQGQYNAPYTPPTPPKKKSKAPMIIGIIVGVIVVLGIIGAIAGSGDSGNDPTETLADPNSVFESIPSDAVSALEPHSFEITQNGVTLRHTYYCSGDKIINWTQTATISIAGKTQDEIDNLIATCDNDYNNTYASYTFISHGTEIVGDTLVETYKFTGISDHIQELKDLGLISGNIITLYVSLEQSRTDLLAQGFTEVE